jgi:hypothetical protein
VSERWQFMVVAPIIYRALMRMLPSVVVAVLFARDA